MRLIGFWIHNYKGNDFKPSRHKVYVVYDGVLVR